ncbi:30S ribosomal protein S11 [Candidatus Falkowbacteria bacterium]|nr:30S ribosomal protein S11 [Candidatus Falkowbacteria bacterium]
MTEDNSIQVKEEKAGKAEENPSDFVLAETGEKGDKKKKDEEKAGKPRKKKKTIRPVPIGRAYVQATYNNTIVTLTDQAGNVIAFSSAGLNGFKGPKKATPYAATMITKDAVEKSRAYGLKDVNVFVTGVGMGREAAVRALNASGLNVLAIKDITPIPHNGCKRRKARRV